MPCLFHFCCPQVAAASKQAGRLDWLLQNAFSACVNLSDADADLALAVGVPALYRTLASLALQARLVLCCAALRGAARAVLVHGIIVHPARACPQKRHTPMIQEAPHSHVPCRAHRRRGAGRPACGGSSKACLPCAGTWSAARRWRLAWPPARAAFWSCCCSWAATRLAARLERESRWVLRPVHAVTTAWSIFVHANRQTVAVRGHYTGLNCSALQAPFRLDPRLPKRDACAALLRMIGPICTALDAVAPGQSGRAAAGVLAACSAGPGGEDRPGKWARLQAELLPLARQQAEQAAARSSLAGISSGALACLALRQAGCNNSACTNLVGSSERGLQFKLCSTCKVGWGGTAGLADCLAAGCSGSPEPAGRMLHLPAQHTLGPAADLACHSSVACSCAPNPALTSWLL